MYKTNKNRKPERTDDMRKAGQHWVWLNGATPPQWGIRATGALVTRNEES